MSVALSKILKARHPQSMLIDNNLMDQLQPPTIASASFCEHGASPNEKLGID
jgi:hypothetical protein